MPTFAMRWKIVTRILVGFLALFALILVSGGLNFRDLVRSNHYLDRYSSVAEETLHLTNLESSLAELRQRVVLALLSGEEKNLRGSLEVLAKAQQQLETWEGELLLQEESGTLYRIGEIVESWRVALPRLAELVVIRQQLFYGQWLPAEQELAEQLAVVSRLYREENEGVHGGKLVEAAESLHKISLMLARLTGMNDSAELSVIANEGKRLEHAIERLAERAPLALRGALARLQPILQHAIKVEKESSTLAHTLLQVEATEITTLVGGLVAGHTRYLQRKSAEFSERNHAAIHFVGMLLFVVCLLALMVAAWLSVTISHPLQAITEVMGELAEGSVEVKIPGLTRGDEIGAMARALHVLQRTAREVELQHWVKNTTITLNQTMLQATTVEAFAQSLVEQWVPLIGGVQGALFYFDEGEQRLRRCGAYALTLRAAGGDAFALGEGIIGQCARTRQIMELDNVPSEYAWMTSGIGVSGLLRVTIVPLLWKERLQGILEISAFTARTERQQALLEEVAVLAAMNLELLRRSLHTQELLQRTQQQAEALQASQDILINQEAALQVSNQQLREHGDVLAAQTEELRTSEEELRVQGEELRAANEALAEKAKMLEEREKALIEARQESEKRAFERELASRYKSEFLANMSHELRTPLNSLLILAENLAENGEGNLHPDQVESANIIRESGSHLLRLINDILDISKVEAGRMDVVLEAVQPQELLGVMERRFRRMAQSRGIELVTEEAAGVATVLYTDRGKVEQILTNLLGNAIKFTERGTVRLEVVPWPGHGVGIRVVDSGIGIAPERLEHIFEAFAQENGTTGRRFGGTGLGLTIARKLAQLLGGEIRVSSQQGVGSQFTVWLPDAGPGAQRVESPLMPPEEGAESAEWHDRRDYPQDDRALLQEGDTVILVVEDDPVFAGITYGQAKSKGLRCLLAADGESGLQLAQRFRPKGIILDVGLPDMDGWGVMNRLKEDPQTQSIPVHFVSAVDARLRALGMGAVGFLTKPVTQEQLTLVFDRVTQAAQGSVQKQVLVMDADDGSRQEVVQLLRHAGVMVEEAANGEACLSRLRAGGVQCLILDLGVAVSEGVAFLHRLVTELGQAVPPVVVYSPRNLTADELLHFREFTDSIIIRSDRSNERLQEEVESFLLQVQDRLPVEATVAVPEITWEGRKILVVDDDMRNTFALSKVLRGKGMKVLMAQDGNKALAQLATNRDVQLILMDVMMPDKDGLQATQEIRAQEVFRNVPIVALTAKAMAGDRERCLAAGANDYLSKPVVVEELFAKMAQLLSSLEQKSPP
ncbi:MAG: response regulator [Magnetococcales bacterium]|nr:response regulator [Magnetococcales bacterium]MBF0114179.1 response regulator [Magnetococcales bacterium]